MFGTKLLGCVVGTKLIFSPVLLEAQVSAVQVLMYSKPAVE